MVPRSPCSGDRLTSNGVEPGLSAGEPGGCQVFPKSGFKFSSEVVPGFPSRGSRFFSRTGVVSLGVESGFPAMDDIKDVTYGVQDTWYGVPSTYNRSMVQKCYTAMIVERFRIQCTWYMRYMVDST